PGIPRFPSFPATPAGPTGPGAPGIASGSSFGTSLGSGASGSSPVAVVNSSYSSMYRSCQVIACSCHDSRPFHAPIHPAVSVPDSNPGRSVNASTIRRRSRIDAFSSASESVILLLRKNPHPDRPRRDLAPFMTRHQLRHVPFPGHVTTLIPDEHRLDPVDAFLECFDAFLLLVEHLMFQGAFLGEECGDRGDACDNDRDHPAPDRAEDIHPHHPLSGRPGTLCRARISCRCWC